jgi:hypothetical protein
MKFAYEDLSPEQFEQVAIAICHFLLGAGVQGFAKGPDGGRDAKFVGTAELHPSKAEPWKGTVIIQAKHTNGVNKTFSDADFFSAKNEKTVLGEELPRIKALRSNKSLDHYMLFSNRRLTGNAETTLRRHICKECNLPEPSVSLCGIEQLEMWLKRFREAVTMAEIDPLDAPLLVSPDDLAEVVEHLAEHLKKDPLALSPPTDRVPFDRKNAANKMSAAYAATLRRNYLKETPQIKAFLAAPENAELLARYESAIEEFQLKIVAKRKDYQSFDDVMNYLFDFLFGRDPILRVNKKLTRAVLFYMYWNCDIGSDGCA